MMIAYKPFGLNLLYAITMHQILQFALVFPIGVNKAVLYKRQGEKLIFVGKTGWAIAVIARTISYEDNRIDLVLKAHSQTNYFIQVPRIRFQEHCYAS